MRHRMSFRVVQDNTRRAAANYEGRFRRCTFRQSGALAKHARFAVRKGQSGYPKRRTGAYDANIRFAYDPSSKTSIVGPTRLKHFNVPRGLEFGGTTRYLIRGSYRTNAAGDYTFVRGVPQSGLQKVRPFQTMRRAANSAYVQLQWQVIAREELA